MARALPRSYRKGLLTAGLTCVMASAGVVLCGLPAHAVTESSAAAETGRAQTECHPASPSSTYGFADPDAKNHNDLRVAVLNAELSETKQGALGQRLANPDDVTARKLASTIQHIQPDVLVLTGFDLDPEGHSVEAFATNYLAVAAETSRELTYPHTFTAEVNTGQDSGADLDGDGVIGGPDDALSPGDFPGQSGMVIYSKYPIDEENARTFTDFAWADIPDSRFPAEEFPEVVRDSLPVSTVGHWDVPIVTSNGTIHVLTAAPVKPHADPVAEARNADEIRLLADYISGADYIIDDDGVAGGLETGAPYVVAAGLNADPNGCLGSQADAVSELLETVEDPLEGVPGTAADTQYLPGQSARTARADYVLVDPQIGATSGGVFWPTGDEPGAQLVQDPHRSSLVSTVVSAAPTEHRIVWADIPVLPYTRLHGTAQNQPQQN